MDVCGTNPVFLKQTVKCERSKGKPIPNENSLNLLRSVQGVHAPLRLLAEMRAAKKVSRLPFLESSNVMLDSLTGRDVDFGFEDFLAVPEFAESSLQPHRFLDIQDS